MRRNLISLALAMVGVLMFAAPASAQNICTYVAADGSKVACSAANPMPTAPAGVSPASSTAATGSVTSSAVNATTGATPAFSSGTATIPFTPKIGYGVRLVLNGGATFIASVGTSVDACATVTTLTAGGAAVSYTGSVNEYIDVPVTTIPVVYCLVIAVTSGTENYGVRN